MKKIFLASMITMVCISTMQAHICRLEAVESKIIYNDTNGYLAYQTIVDEDGKIIFRILGWIAGYLVSEAVSSFAESVCTGLGGESSTCAFVGDAAGMLVGMKRGRSSASRVKSYNYRNTSSRKSSSVNSRVSYDKNKDKGEVSYESESSEVIDHLGQSLVEHLFKVQRDRSSESARYQNQSSTLSPSSNYQFQNERSHGSDQQSITQYQRRSLNNSQQTYTPESRSRLSQGNTIQQQESQSRPYIRKQPAIIQQQGAESRPYARSQQAIILQQEAQRREHARMQQAIILQQEAQRREYARMQQAIILQQEAQRRERARIQQAIILQQEAQRRERARIQQAIKLQQEALRQEQMRIQQSILNQQKLQRKKKDIKRYYQY